MTIIKSKNLDPAYITYLDEAGDDGLEVVRPFDKDGSSEWMMMAAVVIRAEHEGSAAQWVADILGEVKKLQNYQLPSLHFKNLNTVSGRRVCEMLSKLPVRCFVVASNKKNMKGYENPFAAQIPSKNWFYCWLTRLLLERVTYFASQKSISEFGVARPLRIELSERGRFGYGQLEAYYEWLRIKSVAGRTFLPLGDLSWDVMSREHFIVRPNELRPGLQLSDVVASSFFRAADIYHTSKHDPECAKLLMDRMCREPDKRWGKLPGFGVKLMPRWELAKLLPQQEDIFRFYGFPGDYPGWQWWMPKKK